MQYGHCVVSATATAINSLYLSGITPPLNAASSNATNPWKASGASSPSFLNFARFFMSYIVTSLIVKKSRPNARDVASARHVAWRIISSALHRRSVLQVHLGAGRRARVDCGERRENNERRTG